ncbi:diguanylate cyclase domain-containing protein [Neptuniibacter sp. QD48_11]|uniref:sensor domain-containing protein n=1 Tax=Neptuniibacter sp. QD48_11 TaxID=3398211 RepID=UPI0039F5C104
MNEQQNDPSKLHPQTELSMLDQLSDMIAIVDQNNKFVAVNKGYENFFGISKDAFIGKTVAEVHGTEAYEQQIKDALEQAFMGNQAKARISQTSIFKQQHTFEGKFTSYSGSLITDLGAMVVLHDITDLIEAHKELEREQELLHTIINAVPDFIFAKSPEGVYQLCNKSFEEFLDTPAEDILGRTDYELMSKTSAEYIANKDKEVRETLEAQRCDEWVSYKDGRRRLLDMYKLPLKESNSTEIGVLGIGRNVTFEREAEQNLLLASLVFDATPDPCIILSDKGEIISSNEAAQTQFPQLKDKTQSLQLNELLYSPERDAIDLDRLTESNGSWCGEICSHDHRTYFATLNAVQGQSVQANKFVLIVRDEKTHSAMADNLLTKAYQDPLTDLPNRRLFYSRLESAISRAERQLSQLAVIYIDLDKFKPVNDQYGHATGDKVLREVAKRLKHCFRSTDTIARIGGDEFVALIDIEKREQAILVAEKCLNSLVAPFDLKPAQHIISASIGISIFPEDAGSAEILIQRADKAMYQAKHSADTSVCYFSE